ncbi:MAG: SDR family oxidoreductase [Rhodobiaceae bacterium]|nr:SDR family oxidoreductase [Rhodobiaceae bacterium]
MAILVTGGTKGIGLAIAKRLSKSGEDTFLVYHSDDVAAEDAKMALEAMGARVHLIKADIGSIDGAAAIHQAVADTGATLRGIVHSAALIYPTTLLDADLEKFTRAVETNGLSLLYLVQKLLPVIDRGTSIVFITSGGARIPQPRYGALGVGKALAESIVRYLVMELAPKGIRINGVAPGLVATTSVADMVGSQDAADRLFEKAAKANPSGRMSKDSDYASLVEYLMSPEAEFIQGQVIAATGGVGVVG